MAFSTTGSFRGAGLSSEINVTPLTDVLLVMLIIFMVIVPVMPHGLNSALPSPSTKSGAEAAADGPVLVRVEGGETAVKYSVDGISVEKAELESRLVEMLARSSSRQMLIKADAELEFGVVAVAINAGQAARASGIGLVTLGVVVTWELRPNCCDIN